MGIFSLFGRRIDVLRDPNIPENIQKIRSRLFHIIGAEGRQGIDSAGITERLGDLLGTMATHSLTLETQLYVLEKNGLIRRDQYTGKYVLWNR